MYNPTIVSSVLLSYHDSHEVLLNYLFGTQKSTRRTSQSPDTISCSFYSSVPVRIHVITKKKRLIMFLFSIFHYAVTISCRSSTFMSPMRFFPLLFKIVQFNFQIICDRPRENQQKGDDTGTLFEHPKQKEFSFTRECRVVMHASLKFSFVS